ncbi:MAG: hypothetical protein ROY99_03745 [Ignavibacterium sp.]|jgi:hypothetical protein|nr:hypothetical protein [Ignavibacterium sp.]
MRTSYITRLLFTISFVSALLIAGCVDTSVNPIPDSIEYSSQIKVVNLVSGAGLASLILNGQSLGSADLGGEVPGSGNGFLTITSGNKTLTANFASANSNSYKFAATTERKFRVFLVGNDSSNSAVVMNQRYVWQTKDSKEGEALFPDGFGWVAFFNGSPDAVLNSVSIDGTETTFTGGLATGKAKGYIKLTAGSHSFNISYNDTLNTTFDLNVASKSRYTAVVYDVAASIKNAVLVDD